MGGARHGAWQEDDKGWGWAVVPKGSFFKLGSTCILLTKVFLLVNFIVLLTFYFHRNFVWHLWSSVVT